MYSLIKKWEVELGRSGDSLLQSKHSGEFLSKKWVRSRLLLSPNPNLTLMGTEGLGENRSLPLGGETSPVKEKVCLRVVFSSGCSPWEPSAAWGPRSGFLFLKGPGTLEFCSPTVVQGHSRGTEYPQHPCSPRGHCLNEALGSEKPVPGPAI